MLRLRARAAACVQRLVYLGSERVRQGGGSNDRFETTRILLRPPVVKDSGRVVKSDEIRRNFETMKLLLLLSVITRKSNYNRLVKHFRVVSIIPPKNT